MNIMQRVGTQYTFLGLILLEDEDGSIVDQITSQYQLNAVNITLEIVNRPERNIHIKFLIIQIFYSRNIFQLFI